MVLKTTPEEPMSKLESVSLSDNENDAPPADLDATDVEILINGSAESPAIMEATEDIESLEDKVKRLEGMVEGLEVQRGQLTAELLEKTGLISNFEKETLSLKTEVSQLEAQIRTNETESESKIRSMGDEMALKVADLKKQFLNANREKESMVMKYAMREKDILVSKRKAEEAEKTMRAAIKEKDDSVSKMKAAVADKAKYQAIADSRLQDVTSLRKDVERWKEEVKIQEAKAASHNSRLRAEVDAHRETREQLDKTIKHLSETRNEIDSTRRECKDFMDKLKSDEDVKLKKEQEQQRQQNAKLIIDEAAANRLTDLRESVEKLTEENDHFKSKLEEARVLNESNGETITSQNVTISGQKSEIVDLLAQVAELESLRHQVQSEEEKVASCQSEMESLRREMAEVQEDMQSCRQKEAELLEFTTKLTDKNVTLQSELSTSQCRSSALDEDNKLLTSSVDDLESKLASTTGQLELEKQKRLQETDMLARKLAEKTKQVESLSQTTLDAENEVQVLKRKHASTIRELTKELQRAKSNQNGCSRASSSSSINQVGTSSPEHQSNSSSRSNLSAAPPQQEIQVSLSVPPDQALVEKMIRLQRTLARKQEKIEFMEEHITTLVEDIKKKNRLVQHYVLKQEPGTLSSTEMDENKVSASTTTFCHLLTNTTIILPYFLLQKDLKVGSITVNIVCRIRLFAICFFFNQDSSNILMKCMLHNFHTFNRIYNRF